MSSITTLRQPVAARDRLPHTMLSSTACIAAMSHARACIRTSSSITILAPTLANAHLTRAQARLRLSRLFQLAVQIICTLRNVEQQLVTLARTAVRLVG